MNLCRIASPALAGVLIKFMGISGCLLDYRGFASSAIGYFHLLICLSGVKTSNPGRGGQSAGIFGTASGFVKKQHRGDWRF